MYELINSVNLNNESSSCTGNPPTRRGYNAAKKLFETKFQGLSRWELDSALRSVFDDQRKRLAECLKLPIGAEVILCPSGSDAEYIPIAMAKSLHPTKTIANGVTQLNEIGSGTAPASVGEYFSAYSPFLGANNEDCLTGFEGIQGRAIAARTSDGEVIDASALMTEYCNEELRKGNFPIIHGVFGGKTGVRDNIMPSSLGGGDKSFGVVDACQGRFSLDEMSQWMEQDSLVLFTTSKFYQVSELKIRYQFWLVKDFEDLHFFPASGAAILWCSHCTTFNCKEIG